MSTRHLSSLIATLALAACGTTPFGTNPDGGGSKPHTDGGSVATDGGSSGGYHPDGWADPSAHGPALKHHDDDCRSCHGNDLTGGTSGVSCDSCHTQGWRTNCTFCHGGQDNDTGAPPNDLFQQGSNVFPAHTAHIARNIKAAYDCTQCHQKPTDALSDGHIFDDTPGVAEVVFNGGLSPNGSYSNQTCGNLYCHGNGRSAGTARVNMGAVSCGSCHAGMANSSQWRTMSGQHSLHLGRGYTCYECHKNTVNAAGTDITNPDLHVNGQKDVVFLASGFTYSGGSCNGTCHGERHGGRRW